MAYPEASSHPDAAWKVITTLWERDLFVLVALALALVTFLVARLTGAPPARRDDRVPRAGVVVGVLVLWAVLVFALLVWEPALFRAHVAQLVPPLALLASIRPPPWVVLAIAGLVVAPFWAVRNHTILWPHGYRGNEAAVVGRLPRAAERRARDQRRPRLRVARRPRPTRATSPTRRSSASSRARSPRRSLARAAAARRRVRGRRLLPAALRQLRRAAVAVAERGLRGAEVRRHHRLHAHELPAMTTHVRLTTRVTAIADRSPGRDGRASATARRGRSPR